MLNTKSKLLKIFMFYVSSNIKGLGFLSLSHNRKSEGTIFEAT